MILLGDVVYNVRDGIADYRAACQLREEDPMSYYLDPEQREGIKINDLAENIIRLLCELRAEQENRRVKRLPISSINLYNYFVRRLDGAPEQDDDFRVKFSRAIKMLEEQERLIEDTGTIGGPVIHLLPDTEESDSQDISGEKEIGTTDIGDSQKIFVVYGRNLKARDSMFAFLRSIGLHPIEWSQAKKDTGKPTPYVKDILDTAFSTARAVVVLMTPDDEAYLKKEFRKREDEKSYEVKPTGQARPNVLFEAGMAMGRSDDRTVLVELGELRPFSDIGGLHVVKMDDSTQRRQELAQCLESAGCPVDLSGTDWHTAGDFELDQGVGSERLPNAEALDTDKITRFLSRIADGQWDAARLLFDYLDETAGDNPCYRAYEEAIGKWDDESIDSRIIPFGQREGIETSDLTHDQIKSLVYAYCKREESSPNLGVAFRNPKYHNFSHKLLDYLEEAVADIIAASEV